MKNKSIKSIKSSKVSDRELLTETFHYFCNLRRVVSSNLMKDTCSGILTLIFSLISNLIDLNLDSYGNNEK